MENEIKKPLVQQKQLKGNSETMAEKIGTKVRPGWAGNIFSDGEGIVAVVEAVESDMLTLRVKSLKIRVASKYFQADIEAFGIEEPVVGEFTSDEDFDAEKAKLEKRMIAEGYKDSDSTTAPTIISLEKLTIR